MTEAPAECPFCAMPDSAVVASHGNVFAVRDIRPVSPGHSLLIPRRHVPDWWSLEPGEKRDLDELLVAVRRGIDEEFRPNGYNVGFNDGPTAGQTVFHVHVHVIPRYSGDIADPVGGLRKLFGKGGGESEDAEG